MPKLALALCPLFLLAASSFARAEDAAYKIQIEAQPAKKAQKSVAKIHIAPGPGYHVNKDYPTSVTLTDVPAGVLIERLKQTAKDAIKLEEAGAEFHVAYTASEAGKKIVTGELKFAVCSANSCDPKREKLTIALDVK